MTSRIVNRFDSTVPLLPTNEIVKASCSKTNAAFRISQIDQRSNWKICFLFLFAVLWVIVLVTLCLTVLLVQNYGAIEEAWSDLNNSDIRNSQEVRKSLFQTFGQIMQLLIVFVISLFALLLIKIRIKKLHLVIRKAW